MLTEYLLLAGCDGRHWGPGGEQAGTVPAVLESTGFLTMVVISKPRLVMRQRVADLKCFSFEIVLETEAL